MINDIKEFYITLAKSASVGNFMEFLVSDGCAFAVDKWRQIGTILPIPILISYSVDNYAGVAQW